MAKPVIDQKISLPVFRKGDYFSFKPAASNSPTSWAIDTGDDDLTDLGLAFNTVTGRLSGAFKAEGFYDFAITATNGDGTSEVPLFLPFGIWPALSGSDPTIELNIDVDTGIVSRAIASTGPVLFGKHGDKLMLDVGFTKSGKLIDAPLDTLKCGLVEFMEEPLLAVLNDGVAYVIGDSSARRFRVVVDLDNAIIKSALTNYQNDKDEFFDAVAEFEFAMFVVVVDGGDPVSIVRSSQNFTLRLASDLVPN